MRRLAVVVAVASSLTRTVGAAPCTGASLAVVRTATGAARLRYEDIYRGYAPSFGQPAIIETIAPENGHGGFIIEQPVKDTAYACISSSPPQPICHAEEVDLGLIADGVYDVLIQYTLPPGTCYASGGYGGFVWLAGAMQCSSGPQLLTLPNPAVAHQPTTLTLLQLGIYRPGGAVVKVAGNAITVNDFIDSEPGPPPYAVPGCLRSSVTVGPIEAGTYTVHWLRSDIGPPTREIARFDLAVLDSSVPLFDRRTLTALLLMLAVAGAWVLRR